MFNRKSVNLYRRVFTCNLMFGLLGIVVLVAGSTIVLRMQIDSDSQAQLDSLVSRATSATNIAFTSNGSDALQPLVTRLKKQESLLTCYVVGIDGTYLAHTTTSLVGSVHVEPKGRRVQTNQYEKIVTSTVKGSTQVLASELSGDKTKLASLGIELPNQYAWAWIAILATRLPLAILPALALLLWGSFVMKRLVEPMDNVHNQLQQLANYQSLADVELNPIPTRDAMSVGWNRLVDDVNANLPTLQHRMANQLNSLQEKKESLLLESLTDGIAQTDADGKILFLNSAMSALLGLEHDESSDVSIQSCFEACCDETDQQKIRTLLDPASCHRPAIAEFRKAFDSGDRILRISRQPIRKHNTQSRASDVNPGQAWSIRDITQQKLADKARDEFLDSATHELRTPLANIKAYAETLELNEMIDVEQQKEFCNIINSEATRLARFIDELLDVSSIEAGSLAIQRQKVDLPRLLEEAMASIGPVMAQKKISFESALAEKLPTMMLDKDKFNTCLINLLGNATKYTPDGGKISFRAKVVQNKLILEVEDTGIGIAEEEISQVFKKFFRSGDHRVHDQTGTGLGLAFADEVIRLHGGTLTVNSQLNHGSVFIISLPVE